MKKCIDPGRGQIFCAAVSVKRSCLIRVLVFLIIVCPGLIRDMMAQTFTTDYLLKTANSSEKFVNSQIYDDSLNVGIGNAHPAEKLDVSGNIRASGALISAAQAGIPPLQVISNAMVSNLNAEFLGGHPASYFSPDPHTHPEMVSGQGIPSQVAFWASDQVITGANELFWDYSTHRLGIGTDAPDADLHIRGEHDQAGIFLSETHYSPYSSLPEDSQWGITNQAGSLKMDCFNGNLPQNILKLTGTFNGGLVEVNGSLKTKRFVMTQGAALNYVLTSTATGTAVWKSPLLATGWSVAGADVYKVGGRVGIGTQQMQARCNIQTADVPGLIINVNNPDGWGYGMLARVNAPDVAAFAVEQSGQTTLMIWGDGRIHASRIRVKVPVFPDFVFGKSYTLQSLPELKKYIQQNGHLPGVPTAAEVEKNGMDVGDMNTLLLQKVEELTLYVLGLYEENIELRAMMDAAGISADQKK